jgi:hypothetical protein
VLLALLAGALVAPAARASCGDYVRVAGPSAEMPAHAARPPGSVPDAPCSGPLCSRHDPQPPLTPLVPPPERGDQWGCMAPAVPVADEEPFDIVPAGTRPHPVRHGLAVYHPPR